MVATEQVVSFDRLEDVPVDPESFRYHVEQIGHFVERPASRPKTKRRIEFEISERSAAIMEEYSGHRIAFDDGKRSVSVVVPRLAEDVDPRDHGFTSWLADHYHALSLATDTAVEAALARTQLVAERTISSFEVAPSRDYPVWLKTIGQSATSAAIGQMELGASQGLDREDVYTSDSLHTVVRGEAFIGGVVTPGEVVAAAFTDLRAIRRDSASSGQLQFDRATV